MRSLLLCLIDGDSPLPEFYLRGAYPDWRRERIRHCRGQIEIIRSGMCGDIQKVSQMIRSQNPCSHSHSSHRAGGPVDRRFFFPRWPVAPIRCAKSISSPRKSLGDVLRPQIGIFVDSGPRPRAAHCPLLLPNRLDSMNQTPFPI